MHSSYQRRTFKLPSVPESAKQRGEAVRSNLVDPDAYVPPPPVIPDAAQLGMEALPLGATRGVAGALPPTMPATLPTLPNRPVPHHLAREQTPTPTQDPRATGTLQKALEARLDRERLRASIARYSPTVVFRECLQVFGSNPSAYGPLWKLLQDEHQRYLAGELNRDTRVGDMKGTLWGALTAAQSVFQDEVLQAQAQADLEQHVKSLQAERTQRIAAHDSLRKSHTALQERHRALQGRFDEARGELEELRDSNSKKVNEMSKLEARVQQIQAVLDAYGEADEGKLGVKMLAALQKADFKQEQVNDLEKDYAKATLDLRKTQDDLRRAELQMEHFRTQYENEQNTVITLQERTHMLEEDLARAIRAAAVPSSPSASNRRATQVQLANINSFAQIVDLINPTSVNSRRASRPAASPTSVPGGRASPRSKAHAQHARQSFRRATLATRKSLSNSLADSMRA